MGKGSRWLSTHTVPYFIWLYSTLHYEPDQIIHENTARFDASVMMEVLCNDKVSETFPRHPLARPLLPGKGAVVIVQG